MTVLHTLSSIWDVIKKLTVPINMWRHWTKFVWVLNIDKFGWVYDEGFAITQAHYINAILSLNFFWFSLSRKYKYKYYYSSPTRSEFFFVATKKGLANLTKENLGTKKNNSPHFEKKKLEVARFTQCVGRQN